jgi:hypothetical protein
MFGVFALCKEIIQPLLNLIGERRKTMNRKSTALVIAFAILIVFASFVIAEQEEKGWEKTVTLQSGELILDMSGEWDMLQEGYGPFGFRGPLKDILTIRQEGATFTAIKQIGSHWVPKGAETIKGELDKDGFKTVFHYIKEKEWWTGAFIWEPCKWIITENGDKVVLDCGDRIRATLTRR